MFPSSGNAGWGIFLRQNGLRGGIGWKGKGERLMEKYTPEEMLGRIAREREYRRRRDAARAAEPPAPAEAAVPAPENPGAYQQVMRRYDRLDNRHLPGHAEPGHGHTLP